MILFTGFGVGLVPVVILCDADTPDGPSHGDPVYSLIA